MPIQSMSFNNIAFRGDVIKKEDATVSDKKGKSEADLADNEKKKLAFTLGGLTILGATIAFAVKNGKKIPSELSIEKFKKAGGFEKVAGENNTERILAIYKKKPYTGVITVSNKDGNFAIQYENGILKESVHTKTNIPDGSVAKIGMQDFNGVKPFALRKTYPYGDSGKLKMVQRFRLIPPEGKSNSAIDKAEYMLDSVTTIKDGNVNVRKASADFRSVETMDTYFNENGEKTKVRIEFDFGKDNVGQKLKQL